MIRACRGHGEDRISGVGGDPGGEELRVGQGDGGTAQRHQDGTALGIGGEGGRTSRVRSGRACRARGACGTDGARRAGGAGRTGGSLGRPRDSRGSGVPGTLR